jgi:hypothetical protein
MTEKEMANELRNRKYSDAAIEEILGQTKKNPNWKNTRKVGTAERKAKRTNSGKNTTQTPTTNGSGVPPQQTKTLTERAKELIDNIKNKKMSWGKLVAWAAGIGIGVTALWWWLYNNSDTIPDGTPETEPKDDNSQWAPCINELIKSGEGTVGNPSASGQISVTYLPDDINEKTKYPQGLYFYSNGRVMDVATNKMGAWKCKGTTPVIAESQKISISGLLKEQSSEVDVKTMSNYVDVAVDDLDGFVDGGNLTSLLNILKALNGKTFQGKNAISEFLSLYKEDEGGDDFVADVNSVGVKTLGSEAILAKREVIALAKSGAAAVVTPDTTKSGKVGLSKIDITWDGEKSKDDGSKPIVKPVKKETNYHDCSTKEVFEFGCISPKIAEIQGCLGITPQKGYFGPKTRKALTDMFGETSLSGGITKDMYDKVMASCDESKVSARKKYSPEELKTIPAEKLKQTTGLKTGDIKMPDITPLADTNKGERIYKLFQGNYETRNQEGNENDSYLFQEGNRIKYKGAALSQENLDLLSGYISSLGYDFMKAKPKDDYEFKYVWLKR